MIVSKKQLAEDREEAFRYHLMKILLDEAEEYFSINFLEGARRNLDSIDRIRRGERRAKYLTTWEQECKEYLNVKRLAAAAPPLTSDQKIKLFGLLCPGHSLPDSLVSEREREERAELAAVDQERVQLARAFESIYGRRSRVRRHDGNGAQESTS